MGSFADPAKHFGERILTEEGMQIDDSEKQFAKTRSAMCDSLESDWNVTVESW
jgi:hypothetical protein